MWAWEEREAEARRRVNLGTGDIEADRTLLEMAGLIGGQYRHAKKLEGPYGSSYGKASQSKSRQARDNTEGTDKGSSC